MEAGRRASNWSKPRLILALAVALVVLMAAIGLVRVDAEWGAPAGPDRLLRLIDSKPASSPADDARAHAILQLRPIDGRAYRVLARIADAQGDSARADVLYGIAVRRAPRDRPTRAALIDRAFATNDLAAGFEQLDALFRVAPTTREPLLRALMPSLVDARVQTAFIERLISDPPWRPSLATVIAEPATDPSTGLDLLTRLEKRMSLSPEETDARIVLLQRSGQDAAARRAWLATLPPGAREHDELLFDGSFEHLDVQGAYGWRLSPSPGVEIASDDVTPKQGKHALAIGFSGRAVTTLGLEQSLALIPGHYRLTFAADNDTDAQRPIVWRLSCRQGAELLSLPFPEAGKHGWEQATGDFTVPPDCFGQTLRLELLARSIAESQLSGTLYLNAMRIALQ